MWINLQKIRTEQRLGFYLLFKKILPRKAALKLATIISKPVLSVQQKETVEAFRKMVEDNLIVL